MTASKSRGNGHSGSRTASLTPLMSFLGAIVVALILWYPSSSHPPPSGPHLAITTKFSSDTKERNDSGDKYPKALKGRGPKTILAYGALLSESSARLTFPALTNFRLARVRSLRRVFAHPHLFLIGQNIIDPSDPALHLASLSAEEDEHAAGFVVAAFDVHLDDEQRAAFVERERAYRISSVPYYDLDSNDSASPAGEGVICLAGTDDDDLPQALAQVLERLRSLDRSVWHWERDSGLLPADIYLRHCLLAVKKAGLIAERSFREETFLVDRITSLANYLARDGNEERIMAVRPPASLMQRFNG